MDPITIIVTALAAGAAAGLKPTAEQAIKDAYAGMKTLMRRYGTFSLEALEQKPESGTKRTSIAADLANTGAGDDKELLAQAKSLLDLVKKHDPSAAAKLNIKLDEIETAYFNLKNAVAEGDVSIGIKKSTFSGGIDMEGLTAGITGKK